MITVTAETLIEYFEDKLTLKTSDLVMEHDDRMILVGNIDLLDQIKEIAENGFPNQDEDEE